jgi:hypothetical protein
VNESNLVDIAVGYKKIIRRFSLDRRLRYDVISVSVIFKVQHRHSPEGTEKSPEFPVSKVDPRSGLEFSTRQCQNTCYHCVNVLGIYSKKFGISHKIIFSRSFILMFSGRRLQYYILVDLKKVKVKLYLCLTKHCAMKTYWGVEV